MKITVFFLGVSSGELLRAYPFYIRNLGDI